MAEEELSAEVREMLEFDKLFVRCFEFAIYRTFCGLVGINPDNADSLERFLGYCKSQGYKLLGEG